MDIAREKDICIIGAGRLGITLAHAILNTRLPGVYLKSISSKRMESLKKAKDILGTKLEGVLVTTNNIQCANSGNCIFICTPDDVIEGVCAEIAAANPLLAKGKIFIHFSGAKTLKVMEPVKKMGGITASVHPLKSFASIEDSIRTLPGTIYGVTFPQKRNSTAVSFIKEMIGDLSGTIIEIKDKDKSLYHAAACVVSNFLVTLINYAVVIHQSIGVDSKDSINSLSGLIEGTIDNIKKLGPTKALTGPIARGDVGTVTEHLENLEVNLGGQQENIYKIMGGETARIAFQNGWIDRKTLQEFNTLFALHKK